jgi:hypothetical protein
MDAQEMENALEVNAYAKAISLEAIAVKKSAIVIIMENAYQI